jgi:hypothetical protein
MGRRARRGTSQTRALIVIVGATYLQVACSNQFTSPGVCTFEVVDSGSPYKVQTFTGEIDKNLDIVRVYPIASAFNGSPLWQAAHETTWHAQYRPRWNMLVYTPEQDNFNQQLFANVRQAGSGVSACGHVTPPSVAPQRVMKVTILPSR